MSEDKELERLTAKKMLELKRKMTPTEKPKEKSSRDLVASRLVDRGLEVLELAEKSYPEQTTLIVEKLAEVIRKGGIGGPISGGELLWLFRQLGLNIQVKTSILIENHGKLIPLTEKLKSED